jgi:hypothetical protein
LCLLLATCFLYLVPLSPLLCQQTLTLARHSEPIAAVAGRLRFGLFFHRTQRSSRWIAAQAHVGGARRRHGRRRRRAVVQTSLGAAVAPTSPHGAGSAELCSLHGRHEQRVADSAGILGRVLRRAF